jgi:hypothetical protein
LRRAGTQPRPLLPVVPRTVLPLSQLRHMQFWRSRPPLRVPGASPRPVAPRAACAALPAAFGRWAAQAAALQGTIRAALCGRPAPASPPLCCAAAAARQAAGSAASVKAAAPGPGWHPALSRAPAQAAAAGRRGGTGPVKAGGPGPVVDPWVAAPAPAPVPAPVPAPASASTPAPGMAAAQLLPYEAVIVVAAIHVRPPT